MENQNPDHDRVKEIGPLLEEIKQVKKQARLVRVGFAVLLLVIVLGWVWSLYSHFQDFDVEKLGSEMSQRAEKSWPLISEELDGLMDVVIPMAEASLQKELETVGPQIAERFAKEAQLLEEGVKQSIQASMKKHLSAKNRSDVVKGLVDAFPALANEDQAEKLAVSLQESFLKSSQVMVTKVLVEYYDTLIKFEGAFNKIKADVPPDQRPATLEVVLSLWMELVYDKMGGDSTVEVKPADGKKKSRGKKGKRG